MLHEPAAQSGKDYGTAYKTRLGVIMFVIYAIIYAGFIAINLIDADLTEKIIFQGLNIAVVYGYSLIILALIMAGIYNHMCTSEEKRLKALEEKKGSEQ